MPVEELIRTRQQQYYDALGKSDRDSDSCTFVELMLEILLDTLKDTLVVGQTNTSSLSTVSSPIQKLIEVLGKEELSAVELMARLQLSHRPTFRKNYLIPALEQGIVEMTIPNKPNSRNQKYKLK